MSFKKKKNFNSWEYRKKKLKNYANEMGYNKYYFNQYLNIQNENLLNKRLLVEELGLYEGVFEINKNEFLNKYAKISGFGKTKKNIPSNYCFEFFCLENNYNPFYRKEKVEVYVYK